MRILFLAYEIPFPPNDGGRIRTYNILKQIAQRHTVTFVAFKNPDNKIDTIEGIQPYCEQIIALPRLQPPRRSTSAKVVDILRQRPRGLEAFYSDEMKQALKRLLQSKNFDVVHIDQIYLSQYWQTLAGLPRVETHHNVEAEGQRRSLLARPDRYQPRWWLSWLEYLRWQRYEVQISNKMDALVAVSERDATYFHQRAPQIGIFVVPNGVDVEYFSPQLHTESGILLLFSGRMNYEPNSDAMIWFCQSIWPQLRAVYPKAELWIVGRDPIREVLELNQVPGVRVTGTVPDTRPYYSMAQVYIAPVRLGSGTRLKLLEAMSMQIPVVSSTLGTEGLVLEPEKEYLLADNAESFVNQVLRLLADPILRETLAIRARQKVLELYDWSKIASIQEAAYFYAIEHKRSVM